MTVYVVWNGNGKVTNEGIFARYFNSKGKALSDEFRVNDKISGVQSNPIILKDTVLCKCNFQVIWKNRDNNSISIKEYSYKDYNQLNNELEIKIPPEINFKNIKFSSSNDGEIILLVKIKEKKYYLYKQFVYQALIIRYLSLKKL